MENRTIFNFEELSDSVKKLAQQPNALSALEMDNIFQRLDLVLEHQNINKDSLGGGATLLLGISGCNKSSLLNHLIGKASRTCSTDIDQSKSGNNYPLVYKDNITNIAYIDTSDFRETDTKNIGSEILTSYLKYKVSKHCPKFKILLVASISSLTDNNGDTLVTYLSGLSQDIKNLHLITKSISLVFTKEDEVIKQQDIIDQLNKLFVTGEKTLDKKGLIILKDIVDDKRIRIFEQPDSKFSISKLYYLLGINKDEETNKNEIISLINETVFADNTGGIFNIAFSKEGSSLITQLLGKDSSIEKSLSKEVINLIKEAFQRAISNGEDTERFQKLESSSLIREARASNIEFVSFVHENCGIDISEKEELNKLEFFHKLLGEEKFNIRLDSVKQEFNNLHIKELMNREPEVFTEGKTITIKGFNVKASHIYNANSSKKFQHLKVQALNKIIFDQDLNFPHSKDDKCTSLSIIAPSWEIMNNIQINLSGNNGEIHAIPKAENGTDKTNGDGGKDINDYDGKKGDDGCDGWDGKPGNDGMNGGNFLGVGNIFHLSDINYKLSVISNGGDGSNGQYGGNGGNGGNGGAPYTEIQVNTTLISNHQFWPEIIKYDEKYPNHHKGDDSNPVYSHWYTIVSSGGKGGKGGNAGKDGDKGHGGKKGTIQFFFPENLAIANNISVQSSDGQDGLQGNGDEEQEARAGRGGTSGNLYVVQTEVGPFMKNKATYALMEPKEHGQEGIRSDEVNTNPSKKSKKIEKISSYNEITDYLKYVTIEESLYPQDFVTSLQLRTLAQNITELSNRAVMLNEIFRAKWNDKNYLAVLSRFGEEIEQFFDKNKDNFGEGEQKLKALKVLNYLYANNKSLLNLVNSYNEHVIVTNIKEYLDLCAQYAEKLQQIKQENIKIECKDSYRKDLKVKIDDVKESIDKLVKDIKTYKTEIAGQFEYIIKELLDNEQTIKNNILLYRERIQEFQSIMEIKMVLDIFSICAKGAAFLGPVGEVAGTVINTAVEVGGSFIQEPNASVLNNLSNNLNLNQTIGNLRNDLIYRQNRAQHKIEEEVNKLASSRNITKLKESLATDIRISEESFENQKKAEHEKFQNIVNNEKTINPKIGEAFAEFERMYESKEGQKKAIDEYSRLYESEKVLRQSPSESIEIFEEQNKLFGNSAYRNDMIRELKQFDNTRNGYTEEEKKAIKERSEIENEETEALRKKNIWDKVGIENTKEEFKKKIEKYDSSTSSAVLQAIKNDQQLKSTLSSNIKEIGDIHKNSLNEVYNNNLAELRKKYEGEIAHNLSNLISSKINHENNIQLLTTRNKESIEQYKKNAWSHQEEIEKGYQDRQKIYKEQRKSDKIAKYTTNAGVSADVVKGVVDMISKRQEYNDKIKKIQESYDLARENLDKISGKKIETMRVQEDLMKSISKNLEGSLNGLGDTSTSSHNEIVIRKLNIKNYLEQIRQFIHINYQTYKAESNLQNIFNRLENHLKSIIELYENIQNFNDQVLLANYIGNMFDNDSDANILSECVNDINIIKLHTEYNIVRNKYLKAANAFGQWAFPFKDEYMKNANIQSELIKITTESDIKELVGIVNKDIIELQRIVIESESRLLSEIESKIKVGYKFNTNKDEYPPFFTWNYDQYKYEIIRLLNLKPVVLYSNIIKAKKLAMKFTKISISIECNSSDSVISSEVNNKLRALEDADLTLTHFGDCQYRFKDNEGKDKVIKINSPYPKLERPPIQHSYDYYHNDGKHKTSNKVHVKLEGKAILSPYATWEIQLAPLIDDKRIVLLDNLQHIAKNQEYLKTIEVHLVGEGQYVECIEIPQASYKI